MGIKNQNTNSWKRDARILKKQYLEVFQKSGPRCVVKYGFWHIWDDKVFSESAIQPNMYESANEPKALAASPGSDARASFPVLHYLESEPF